jgi:hypothetical protein
VSAAILVLEMAEKVLDGFPIYGPKAALAVASKTLRNLKV